MLKRKSKYDILAIGDITTDIFIRLEDAKLHCKIDDTNCELCVRFGDKIPYKETREIYAVGNAPNASVCFAKLGLKSAILTNIGNDDRGKKCLTTLKKKKVSTKLVKKERNKETNCHFVLSYDKDRTILVKHSLFNYHLPRLPRVSWIYLSSLAENSIPYHKMIIKYLEKHPEIKLAFSPGTFQIKIGAEKLKEIYKRTYAFFSNIEEAEKILGLETKDPLTLGKGIHKLGPKIVVISNGEEGAYLYYNDSLWHIPVYPNNNPVLDRTGAGDSFASTIVSALAIGLPPTEAFMWGPINPMSVVQKVGAQEGLLNRKELLKYLKESPNNYKPKKLK
ncbi:MAG: carbohydrate kinase family protein [Candidatus Paceibacterota bacterium]|jgi:ribokinase